MLQLLRRRPEDGIGQAGGGPNFVLGEQVLVDQHRQRPGVAERRHAPNGVAGRHSHLIAIRAAHLCRTHDGGQADGIEAIGAGDEGHDRIAVRDEDERLHDLGYVAADGARCVLGGASARGKAHDLDLETGAGRGLHDAQDAGMQGPVFRRRHGPIIACVLPSPRQPQERQGSAQALRVREGRRPSNLIWIMPAKGVGVKAIVVAGGDAAPDDAALLLGVDLLIAADSGATWLAGIGVRPDVVIGDMDSVDPSLLERLEADGVAIERHPSEKDASDAELAVARAVSAGADELLVLGALGGERLDHGLTNVLLLADRSWSGVAVTIVRGDTTLRAVHGGNQVVLGGAPGDLVTLLSVDGDAAGVRTRGLRYPLNGEALALGRSRGLSNEVEQAPASVSLERGTLLVIETRIESRA